MLVKHGEYIAKVLDNETLAPYEVICADEKTFVVAPCRASEAGEIITTDYTALEAYSNVESTNNTLEKLHFIKLENK